MDELSDYDDGYGAEPDFEEILRDLAMDAVFDGLSQDEFAEMARAAWALMNQRLEAARNAPQTPPEPPAPFISIHTRDWLTGEETENCVVMQDRPK